MTLIDLVQVDLVCLDRLDPSSGPSMSGGIGPSVQLTAGLPALIQVQSSVIIPEGRADCVSFVIIHKLTIRHSITHSVTFCPVTSVTVLLIVNESLQASDEASLPTTAVLNKY